MSGNPRKPKKKGKKRSTYDPANPPASVSVYSGPHRLPASAKNLRTVVTTLSSYDTSDFTTGVTGVLASAVNNDPSGYGDWSSLAAIYDDFRVLHMSLHFVPISRYTTLLTKRPVLTAIDNDSTGVPTSYGATANFESAVIRSIEDPFSMEHSMSGPPDDDFITTIAPAATWAFKFYSDGNTASSLLGAALVTLIVQFRGRA